MVLRKPYRFLMKHFKIIHLTLLLLSVYLISKTNSMLSFFNEYLESSTLVSVYNLKSNLFNGFVFFVPILILLIISSIIYLLYLKKKPIKFYLFNMSIFVFSLITYIYIYSVCNTLELKLVDIRVLKIVDNLLVIMLALQLISAIFFGVRGLGFDLKKFNFKNESDFEISDADSEEFEFDVNFDSNNLKRSFNQKKRNIIYGYHENKFVINIVLGVVSLIVFLLLLRFLLIKFKHYQIGEMFYADNYSFEIGESYITNENNKNKQITDNILIVARVKIKGYKKDNKFNPAQFALVINNIPYNFTMQYIDSFKDIGTVYKNQKLDTKTYKTYLMVFEIPKKYKNRTKYIRFYNANKQHKNIKIRPQEFKKHEYKEVGLGQKLEIKNKYIDAELTIDDIDVKYKMKFNYLFTINGTTYNSYEYLVPSYNDNYEKKLLKLDSTFKIKDRKSSNIKSLFDLLYYNGAIEYKIDGKTKIMKNINREVKPKSKNTNKTFIEVAKEFERVDSITLIINIRNNIYRYKIK